MCHSHNPSLAFSLFPSFNVILKNNKNMHNFSSKTLQFGNAIYVIKNVTADDG